MKLFPLAVTVTLLLSSCNFMPVKSSSSADATQQSSILTESANESLVATEQARANAVKTAVALTIQAQATFTPPPSLTPTLAYLPTLTPISNSIPERTGAFFDVSPDVLGARYEIKNACYFDTQSGWERYEVYAGAIAGSGDEYSAQGAVVIRIIHMTEQDGRPVVELADTKEYLTAQRRGPLLLPTWNDCPKEWMYLKTSLNFGWILSPLGGEFYPDNHSAPLARLESAGTTQLAELGNFCWNGTCADGGAISTSPVPLGIHSNINFQLILPLDEVPDGITWSAMLVAPSTWLHAEHPYDTLQEGYAEWSYEKPGRTVLDLGALPLKREQDVKLALEPGYYALMVLAYWRDYGDVTYGFLIEVRE